MNLKRTMLIILVVISSAFTSSAFSQTNDKSVAPTFAIERVYLKELSIEQPNSPAIFLEMDTPKIEIGVDTASEKLDAKNYETTVSVVLTAKVKDKIAFVVKVKQAGIFTIENVSQPEMDKVLGIGAPRLLYPYLRANVADIITRAGFPPIHLAELDFDTLYSQRLSLPPKHSTTESSAISHTTK